MGVSLFGSDRRGHGVNHCVEIIYEKDGTE